MKGFKTGNKLYRFVTTRMEQSERFNNSKNEKNNLSHLYGKNNINNKGNINEREKIRKYSNDKKERERSRENSLNKEIKEKETNNRELSSTKIMVIFNDPDLELKEYFDNFNISSKESKDDSFDDFNEYIIKNLEQKEDTQLKDNILDINCGITKDKSEKNDQLFFTNPEEKENLNENNDLLKTINCISINNLNQSNIEPNKLKENNEHTFNHKSNLREDNNIRAIKVNAINICFINEINDCIINQHYSFKKLEHKSIKFIEGNKNLQYLKKPMIDIIKESSKNGDDNNINTINYILINREKEKKAYELLHLIFEYYIKIINNNGKLIEIFRNKIVLKIKRKKALDYYNDIKTNYPEEFKKFEYHLKLYKKTSKDNMTKVYERIDDIDEFERKVKELNIYENFSLELDENDISQINNEMNFIIVLALLYKEWFELKAGIRTHKEFDNLKKSIKIRAFK